MGSLCARAFLLVLPMATVTAPALAAPCPDADLDAYADCAVPDCDDANRDIHPGIVETCNHRDDDCDAAVDEDFTPTISRQRIVDRHPHANDRHGNALASIGDVNADGVPDFVVGSPYDDLGASEGGSVAVHSGADRTVICRATGIANDSLGVSVAAVGDLDGDDTPDFAASSPNHDAVVVFSGADCSQVARCVDTAPGVSGLGSDHGLAGYVDVTGDGIPEILAGADSSTTVLHQGGRAVVFSVSAAGSCSVLRSLDDPALAIYAYLGFAVAGLPDVTGDGVEDIAVGEPGYATYRGGILVFSGADGSLVRRILDPDGASNDHFGESLATIECLDGDGIPELVAGSPRRTGPGGSSAGHVLVLSPEDGIVRRDIVHADGGNDWLGSAAAAVPDIDSDGVDDIVAGASRADTAGGAMAGKVVIFSGATGAEIQELIDAGGLAGDQLGYAVACAGDLSGDGIAEILVGAPYDDGAVGADEGSASIFARETDCDDDGWAPFGGDCDDGDVALWNRPGEVRDLTLAADRTTMSWDVPLESGGSAVTLAYDVLRATAPGGFSTGACIVSDQAATSAQDQELPDAGTVFHYLARAQNGCGEGTLGSDTAGNGRPGHVCP